MITVDLQTTPVRELNRTLHALPADTNERLWRVVNPRGAHSIAAGLTQPIEVEVEGHVGYYCAGMNQAASVTVHGHAGQGLAENIMSGVVRVTGNASQSAGASGHGGLVVIEGDASSRCGISMKGVDIVVRGSVGHMSAFMAQAGHLVVCGDAGPDLGDSLYEAVLYVRGRVAEPRLGLHREADDRGAPRDPRGAARARRLRARPGRLPALRLGAPALQLPHRPCRQLLGRPGDGDRHGDRSAQPEGVGELPRDVIAEIQRAAREGLYEIRGFGAKRRLPTFDDLVFLGASISRYPLEGYRERCATNVTIGARFAARPIELAIPITIAGMSFGALRRPCQGGARRGPRAPWAPAPPRAMAA